MSGRMRLMIPLVLVVMGLVQEADAHAYLDPARGSMLLQLVLGGVASTGMLVKLYWRRAKERLKGFLRRHS